MKNMVKPLESAAAFLIAAAIFLVISGSIKLIGATKISHYQVGIIGSE